MHYHCEVWLPEKVHGKSVEVLREDQEAMQAIMEPILAPYGEESGSKKKIKFWDYWRIGGRWTGEHDGYNPSQDWVNYKTCWLCHGSGVRSDVPGKEKVICNSCHGTGAALEYDPQYHVGDIMRVKDIRDAYTYYTLVLARPRTVVLQSEKWMGMGKGFKAGKWGKDIKKDLAGYGIRDGWLVTVDCHS